jgi:DNA segregation ATPase FtsK/SpoIIIE-like protein
MKAFVRMFMDLVGIFNDEQSFPDEGKLPGGWFMKPSPCSDRLSCSGVSFGMMFGNSSEVHEEWSTDEDDDDAEEEDYDSENGEQEALWEPMARNHIYMNLKEEVSKAREFLHKTEEFERSIDEMEAKRKQKNAKKRSEKRRKQKEKKIREAALKAEEDERMRILEELNRKEQEELARRRKEELRSPHTSALLH